MTQPSVVWGSDFIAGFTAFAAGSFSRNDAPLFLRADLIVSNRFRSSTRVTTSSSCSFHFRAPTFVIFTRAYCPVSIAFATHFESLISCTTCAISRASAMVSALLGHAATYSKLVSLLAKNFVISGCSGYCKSGILICTREGVQHTASSNSVICCPMYFSSIHGIVSSRTWRRPSKCHDSLYWVHPPP